MNLQEALGNIFAPKGVTSILAAVSTGDFNPIADVSPDVKESLGKAQAALLKTQQQQDECRSDWAYWGYEGTLAYLRSLVAILTAAEITGPDNLPNVEPPKLDGIVMDDCYAIECYGKEILQRAKDAQKLSGRSA